MTTDDLDGQTALFPPPDPPDPPAKVYVVATNYADDPHPHIEGVFADLDDADELAEKCRRITTPPHPVAWGVHDVEVR